MGTSGAIVAIVGVVLIVVGIIRHFSTFMLTGTRHVSLGLVVVGAIVLIIGLLMSRQRRPSLG